MTGKSELERACRGRVYDAKMRLRLFAALEPSTELHPLLEELVYKPVGSPSSPAGASTDWDEVAERVLARKHDARTPLRPAVREHVARGLREWREWQLACRQVRQWTQTPFDADNAAHEQALERLWSLLLPGVARYGGRRTKAWTTLGFQGSDPATDFRSMGVFALYQLVYFAESRSMVAQRMVREAGGIDAAADTETPCYYPFALVGIHLSEWVARLLLHAHGFERHWLGLAHDDILQRLHNVYSDTFTLFHIAWRSAPSRSLMEFPDMFRAFCAQIERHIRAGVLLSAPRPSRPAKEREASTASHPSGSCHRQRLVGRG